MNPEMVPTAVHWWLLAALVLLAAAMGLALWRCLVLEERRHRGPEWPPE